MVYIYTRVSTIKLSILSIRYSVTTLLFKFHKTPRIETYRDVCLIARNQSQTLYFHAKLVPVRTESWYNTRLQTWTSSDFWIITKFWRLNVLIISLSTQHACGKSRGMSDGSKCWTVRYITEFSKMLIYSIWWSLLIKYFKRKVLFIN